MKTSRNNTVRMKFALLLGLAVLFSGCSQIKGIIGKDKLNQGILAYNKGRTNEALEFFNRAAELRPEDSKVWICVGAAKYKLIENASTSDHKKMAQEALDAYMKALELATDCKSKDNAFGYIATIWGDKFNDEDKRREWLLKRAGDSCADDNVKAQTFYSIGVKYWQCAYDQSTRYADKTKINAEPFHTRNFYFAPDKQKFDDCLARAFEYVEKAIAIKPDYGEAYSYKSLLYREKQKATSSEADKKKFAESAEKEAKTAITLAAKAKADAEAEAAKQASPATK